MFGTRIHRESRTVAAMIRLYCRHHHGLAHHGRLCDSCRELLIYCDVRLDRCPYGEGKTTCVQCPVHCYQPAMRERIKEVMRFAGPRMLTRHPILSLYHFIDGRRKTPMGLRKALAGEQP